MKKWLSVVFVLLVILTAVFLAGCNKNNGQIGATEPATEMTQTEAYIEPTELPTQPDTSMEGNNDNNNTPTNGVNETTPVNNGEGSM